MGAKLVRLQHCASCGSTLGSGKRFRAALRLVRDDEEVRTLAKAYGPRSKTAHAGQLHGSELAVGVFVIPGTLQPSPTLEFTWGQAYRMKKAARDLLKLALNEGLPPLVHRE